jgi:hypothetical protein
MRLDRAIAASHCSKPLQQAIAASHCSKLLQQAIAVSYCSERGSGGTLTDRD